MMSFSGCWPIIFRIASISLQNKENQELDETCLKAAFVNKICAEGYVELVCSVKESAEEKIRASHGTT